MHTTLQALLLVSSWFESGIQVQKILRIRWDCNCKEGNFFDPYVVMAMSIYSFQYDQSLHGYGQAILEISWRKTDGCFVSVMVGYRHI